MPSEKKEEILQAVIIADSFNENYRPLTLSVPRCLLPLANVPMLEYALESLAQSGIQEIFIVCKSHSDMIKQYLSSSKWNKASVPSIKTIVSQELRSIGDALRELDVKQLLQNDFILISGDVVSNINLGTILAQHYERKLRDKNAIMTILLKQASVNHPTRSKSEEQVFVFDSQSLELLNCTVFERLPAKQKVMIGAEVFKNRSQVSIRNDLIDCQIDICSVEVLALFTENFDYQDIRRDFLTGILESDILGKTIYCHLIEGYAAAASTMQMYHSISKDILMRWTYPLTPDNFCQGEESYSFGAHNIYKGHDLQLDRSVQLHRSVVIGSNSVMGKQCSVTNSVIGKNCIIGSNVILDGAYIFDNVTIKDDCIISKSVVGAHSIILENTTLDSGCIIDYHVTLGPNVTIPQRTLVSSSEQERFGDDLNSNADVKSILGAESIGFLYVREDEEEMTSKNVLHSLIDYESLAEITEGDDGNDSDSEVENSNFEQDEETDWVREVEQTIQRAFDEAHSVDIATLELNTLKMAMNITFKDLRQVVIPSILLLIPVNATRQNVYDIVSRWFPIVKRFTHSESDQVDCLHVIVQFLLRTPPLVDKTPFVIQKLYEIDLIEEDAILEWVETVKDAAGQLKKIKDAAQPFVDWLNDAETDSEEDSD